MRKNRSAGVSPASEPRQLLLGQHDLCRLEAGDTFFLTTTRGHGDFTEASDFSVHLCVLSVVNKVLEVLLDLGLPQNVGPLTGLTVSSIPALRFDDLRHTIITAPGRNRMPDNAPSSRLCGIRYGACWSITSGWRPSGRLLKSRKPRYDAR